MLPTAAAIQTVRRRTRSATARAGCVSDPGEAGRLPARALEESNDEALTWQGNTNVEVLDVPDDAMAE
jgi:hypothetical protein